MTMADTAKLMLSTDYKDRFIAEYIQLKDRYDSLNSLVAKWDAGELSFEPTCPRSTYDIQLRLMKDYLAILEARAKIEDININEV